MAKKHEPENAELALFQAIMELRDIHEVNLFLTALLTEAEVENLVKRWQTICLIFEGYTHREVAKIAKVNKNTVSRAYRQMRISKETVPLVKELHERLEANR